MLPFFSCTCQLRDCNHGTVSQLIDSNRMPHLLFYGPPGTGKTSTILACARKLNGPNYRNMVLEVGS